MNNEDLKPCPFCGGEAELVKAHFFGGDLYAGRCGNCAATSEFEATKEEAVDKWNRRNYPEKQDSSKLTYEELEKMVKPLKWKYISGLKAHYASIKKGIFFKIYKEKGEYVLEINGNDPVAFSATLSKIKQAAQEFLVDLVAAALGVERSGK